MDKITDSEFSLIRDLIKQKAGIHMNDDKKSLVFARLKNHLIKNGFKSFKEYYTFIQKKGNEKELTFFINKLTTNHTFFNRESSHFDFLKNTVLPYIKDRYKNEKDLRLWCAAASTGEEPYNLAFTIADFFKSDTNWNTEILATDISTKVLETAEKGIYSKENCKSINTEHINNYLVEYDSDNYIVKDSIKSNVVFRQFNLNDDNYKFKKKLQVIFCRNVMIYFDGETKEAVVKKLYDALDDGGYLFVSHSESLGHIYVDFEYVQPSIYRKPIKTNKTL